jgi:hypothetical protein
MLNAHPRIAIPEELLYFRSYYAGVPIEQWASPNLSTDAYTSLVRRFVGNVAALHPELDAAALIATILNGPHDLRRPYDVVLSAWALHHGAIRWGEKTPGNLFYIDVIAEMYPDALFLHMVRDPRAGVASMQKADFFPDDVVFNALSRRKHAGAGRRLLGALDTGRWMTVRYEDLTTDPAAMLRRVCVLLGEAYDPAMMQYHRTAEAFMKDDAATTFNAAATRPVTASRINAWRSQLSTTELALIEQICAAEMKEHGYAPTGDRLSLKAYVEYLLKLVYWHVQGWRYRAVRHYTVRHPVLARFRGRIRSLWSRVQPLLPSMRA